MPELPEVETIVRQLSSCVVGQQISQVVVKWPASVATHSPAALAAALVGRTITAVARRGKFILLTVPPHTMLVHLRMTGRLLACDKSDDASAADPHVHVYWELASGDTLFFRDIRKFGRVYLAQSPEQVLGDLGPESLDDALTPEGFAAALHSRRRQIKPLLLDQRFVAGLGNIYVDEALWRTGIHPMTPSDSLSSEQAATLLAAIRNTLTEAIRDGGTTLRDYRNALNAEGQHGPALAAYGRTGQPCLRCGQPIERLVVGSRGTHICPRCQVPPTNGESSHDD
jgi:formamidopyrimidine-DNA glycosylase